MIYRFRVATLLKAPPESISSPCNCRDGRAKGSAVHHGTVVLDELVDFVGWRQHSWWFGCRHTAPIIILPFVLIEPPPSTFYQTLGEN